MLDIEGSRYGGVSRLNGMAQRGVLESDRLEWISALRSVGMRGIDLQ